MSTRFVVWSAAALSVLALGRDVSAQTADLSAPTAIEQALIENACVGALPPGALDSTSYRDCMRARLLSLRTDFGRDLERLTPVERKRLDSRCSGLTASGREAYLYCIDAELTSLLAQRKLAKPSIAAAEAETLVADTVAAASPITAPAPPERSRWSGSLLIGIALGFVIAAAGGARVVLKSRRPRHACRQCGTELPVAGDLCAACRHEAAEARRRAAADERQGQSGDERSGGHEERAGRNQATEPLEAQAHYPGPAVALEQAEQLSLLSQAEESPVAAETGSAPAHDARSVQDADARSVVETFDRSHRDAHQVAAEEEPCIVRIHPDLQDDAVPARVQEAVFDPYVVLGVLPGASAEEIRAAYENAKAKFDPRLVSHLGYEVQKHFKAKAQALDRAYQLLA